MKKALIIVLTAVFIIAAGAGGFFFGRSTVKPARPVLFAEILEINGAQFHVVNLEDGGELIFSADDDTGLFYRGEEVGADSFKAGDRITVFYSGVVLTSYPGQLPEVYLIRPVEREGA